MAYEVNPVTGLYLHELDHEYGAFSDPACPCKACEHMFRGSQLRDGPRIFSTGASRNNDIDLPDYEGFLSPRVLVRYGQYMHKHRHLKDGGMRASDNWQKGIPRAAYMSSLVRHVIDLWLFHRGGRGRDTIEEALCAIMFNAMGYLHEILRPDVPCSAAATVIDSKQAGEFSSARTSGMTLSGSSLTAKGTK